MTDEYGVSSSWLELESDPGLFTLLIDDFGVKGVQVEEIYDLSKPLENSIFGFIFLFKWIERRSRRSKASLLEPHSNYVTDPSMVNKMFFAHQIVPNSCATHALLSILLNCKSNRYLDLGHLLTKFKVLCQGLSPEHKGYAIGNQPKLAEAHNSYAKPELNNQPTMSRNGRLSNDYSYASSSATASSSLGSNLSSSHQTLLHHNHHHHHTSFTSIASSSVNGSSSLASSISTSNTNEIFHFICFVPINGRLYELDGLKPYPVDHGSIYIENNNTCNYDTDGCPNWTNKFKQIIRQRLNSFNQGQQNHEIRFNLMALVPDRMCILQELVDLLKHNKRILNNSIIDLINYYTTNHSKLDKYNEQDMTFNIIKKEIEPNSTLSTPIASTNGLIDFKLNKLLVQQKQQQESNSNVINNDDLNSIKSTTTTTTTRQLRSTRSSTLNLKEDLLNNEQFQFEISFYSTNKIDENDDLNENHNTNKSSNKLIDTIDLYDLCKQYKIESIKHLIKQQQKLNDLDDEIKIDLDINQTKITSSSSSSTSPQIIKRKTTLTNLKQIESKLELDISSEEAKCNEEIEKRKKYRIDALRRKHIYDEFIVTYLNVLCESGKLAELIGGTNSNQMMNNSSNSLSTTSHHLNPHSNGANNSSSSKHNNMFNSNNNSTYSASNKKLKKK